MRRAAFALSALLLVGLIAPAASAAFVERPAELAIDQPHYIDGGVQTTGAGEAMTYEASGGHLRIQPQNFDRSNVTEFGVATTTSDATLSDNTDLGVYELDVASNGTYELYWVAREVREVDNETKLVDIRYTARVRVSDTDMQHIPDGTIDEYREDADNWSAFEQAVRSDKVVGPDADMEQSTETAINLLRLQNHPFSALTGDFTGLLLTLFITLPGLVIILIGVGMHLASRRSDIKERRRQSQLDAERADLEDELDAIEEHERLAALEGMDWNDVPDFDDATARAFREHLGETVLDGWLTIQSILTPETLVRDRLRAMADTHVAVEEPVADGGATAGTPSYRLEPRGAADEMADERVATLDEPSDEVVDGLDWDDPELREFDLTAADIEHSLEMDTLTEDLDVDVVQDFESREEFTEYLFQFLQTVVDHEYTDKDGRVRPLRHALNLWLRALRFVGEREGVPTARYSAEHIESLLRTYDAEDEIAEWVNRVETGQEGA